MLEVSSSLCGKELDAIPSTPGGDVAACAVNHSIVSDPLL